MCVCLVCVCVVCVCVCVHVWVSTGAVWQVRNYVSYTSWKKSVHIGKLMIIIFHWTCSCCALFILYDWNVVKTTPSADFNVIGD